MLQTIKTNKNNRLLMLYSTFINGYTINKTTYCMEHNINERTFERDIGEIRNFLSEIFSLKEVIYDKSNDVYYLSGSAIKYLDKMDATIIIKVLLESGTLRKDEMNGLINKIVHSVDPHDINDVESILKKDMDLYKSKNEFSILKILIDLFEVINRGNDIEITDGAKRNYKILPIRILIENSKFILLAIEDIKQFNYVTIDIENIVSFKILKSLNAKIAQQKYYQESEEMRNGTKI